MVLFIGLHFPPLTLFFSGVKETGWCCILASLPVKQNQCQVDDYERIRVVCIPSLNIQHNITKPEKAAQKREFHRRLFRKQVQDCRMRHVYGCDRMPSQNWCGLQNNQVLIENRQNIRTLGQNFPKAALGYSLINMLCGQKMKRQCVLNPSSEIYPSDTFPLTL